MNLSIVASVGRYVIKNRMFLYSISAGSGLRTFIAELAVDDMTVAVHVRRRMIRMSGQKYGDSTIERTNERKTTDLLLAKRRHTWKTAKPLQPRNSASKTEAQRQTDIQPHSRSDAWFKAEHKTN